jgi:hypothetical protein
VDAICLGKVDELVNELYCNSHGGGDTDLRFHDHIIKSQDIFSTLPIMNKTEFYLSRCTHAASASDMQFSLGSILVKGGKILSSGHNHHRYATLQQELAWV